MYIYKYMRSKGYEMLTWVDDDGGDRFDRLNGKPQGKKWTPIHVRRVRATRREGCKPSDAPFVFMSGVLVFRRSAVDALRDMLDAYGELLPLEDEGGVELYAYNPRALEALDHERTVGSRDKQGRVYLPNNHVFIPSVVEGVDIFRQAQKKGGNIYLGERFVQRWKQAKLKGLDFILAWDSDLPPDQQPNVWTSKPVKL
jgi:hypothetical protein